MKPGIVLPLSFRKLLIQFLHSSRLLKNLLNIFFFLLELFPPLAADLGVGSAGDFVFQFSLVVRDVEAHGADEDEEAEDDADDDNNHRRIQHFLSQIFSEC